MSLSGPLSKSIHSFLFKLCLKTYAAISNAHLSRVCKRGKLSGSCLSTLNGFGSTQLPIFLCHIGAPTFSSQNNSLKCVRNIYWHLFRTDRLSTKDRYMTLSRNPTTYTITLVTNTIVAESILFVWLFRAAHDLTS